MVNASNSTLVVRDSERQYVYKPISGERPLWDFPDGTLAARERAAFLLSHSGGWNVVPETTLRVGPMGLGSFQNWVEAEPTSVDILEPHLVPENWHDVFTGVNENGKEVVLTHANDLMLRRIALFDAVINNADRKAGHILTDDHGQHFAIDHGVTFHHEPKLRTVLWGWMGEEISDEETQLLQRSLEASNAPEFSELLTDTEIEALRSRIAELIETRVFPEPSREWPAIPWPIF